MSGKITVAALEMMVCLSAYGPSRWTSIQEKSSDTKAQEPNKKKVLSVNWTVLIPFVGCDTTRSASAA